MFEPEPNNFDLETIAKQSRPTIEEDLNSDLTDISPENIAQRKKILARLFFLLLGLGIGIGLILSIVLVTVLNHFGILGEPEPIQPEQTQPKIFLNNPWQ
ncbi:MAG: hypothetical protein D6822_01435 [Cyanobacteria bacterium J149]|nr:MAG: hypothetical protein D6822_01435 [Cyanobacteria bacterium J149]